MTAVSKRLGAYQLIHPIGLGGLSEVFLGLKEGKPYAVKCLNPDRAKTQRFVDDFVREVKISSTLKQENVLSIIDHGSAENTYFAVMELIVGFSFQQLIQEAEQQKRRVPLPFSLYVLDETAKALQYLHHTSVFENSNSVTFHGDVSPQNVMIAQDGRVLLVDFGSAGQNTAADPRETPLGKMYYLPPEVLNRAAVTTATDLYSLAIMAFYLLFGQRPFETEDKLELYKKILHEPVPRLNLTGIARSLKDEGPIRIFFNQALHKDPKLRFPTIEMWREAFSKLRFAGDRPKSRAAFLTYFHENENKRFETLAEEWMKKIRDHRAKDLGPAEAGGKSQPVQSLLARVDQRRHPRIEVTEERIEANVFAPQDKARIVVPVAQLSQGGMLVKWEGLVPRVGLTYPLSLSLLKQGPRIETDGKLLYEIFRQSKPHAAFQFLKMAPTDALTLKDFVKTRFSQAGPASAYDSLQDATFDVFFDNVASFQAEYDKNIKQGGMFIRSSRAVKNDEIVIVRIQVGQDLNQVALKGRVVYCSSMETTEKVQLTFGLGLELQHTADQIASLFKKYLLFS